MREIVEAEADIKFYYHYLFTNEGYLFLLIMKIITKIEVSMNFSEVLQKCAF